MPAPGDADRVAGPAARLARLLLPARRRPQRLGLPPLAARPRGARPRRAGGRRARRRRAGAGGPLRAQPGAGRRAARVVGAAVGARDRRAARRGLRRRLVVALPGRRHRSGLRPRGPVRRRLGRGDARPPRGVAVRLHRRQRGRRGGRAPGGHPRRAAARDRATAPRSRGRGSHEGRAPPRHARRAAERRAGAATRGGGVPRPRGGRRHLRLRPALVRGGRDRRRAAGRAARGRARVRGRRRGGAAGRPARGRRPGDPVRALRPVPRGPSEPLHGGQVRRARELGRQRSAST